jgi:hypothetical protein
MENTLSATIDYRQLLLKYMRQVTYVEGVSFIDECSSDPDSAFVLFSEAEIEALVAISEEI